MSVLGILLIILCAPLLIGYAISEKKNQMWLRLGLIMGGVGIVIIILGAITCAIRFILLFSRSKIIPRNCRGVYRLISIHLTQVMVKSINLKIMYCKMILNLTYN